MANMKNSRGKDAAEIEPKFVPDEELLPRDNSGGLDFNPYHAKFGDGGFVTGPKSALSADGAGAPQTDEMVERKAGEKGNRKPAEM